jgi:hypothetical protein
MLRNWISAVDAHVALNLIHPRGLGDMLHSCIVSGNRGSLMRSRMGIKQYNTPGGRRP